MAFGLKISPSIFQKAVMLAFVEYFNNSMQLFLDDFSIYGSKALHLEHL